MKGKGEFRMAKDGITIYDLLISCPGDLKDEIQTIKDAVDEFNKTIGNRTVGKSGKAGFSLFF